MSDRFAAMGQTGPCPTCGTRNDGIAQYRPRDPKALSDEALAATHAFIAKPEGKPHE